MNDVKRNPINVQLVLILILAIFLVIFTLQNAESVAIKLFFWNINIPLVLLILVCLLIGYLLPHFSYIPRIWKLKSELSRTRKEKERLETDNPRQAKKKPHPEGVSFDEMEEDYDGDDDEEDDDENSSKGGFFRE
jgi:lipopolysaccharide assembly protein A